MSTYLGNFELTHEIGAGGMAHLFLAIEHGAEGLQRRVVVKTVHPALASNSHYVALLVEEAKLIAQLRHNNIVQLYGLHEANGQRFFSMEWVDGVDLNALVAQKLPLQTTLHIMKEILAGLEYAHSAKSVDGQPLAIVHRDLSPHNVLLSRAGEVKIGDFGVAKSTAQTLRTVTGQIKGKVSYMSPEQASGRPIDARTDVYAAGLVMYELLAGVRANRGVNDADALYFATQGRIDLAPLAHVPQDLRAVLAQSLAREKEERFPSAAEFQAALQATKTSRLLTGDPEIGKWVTLLQRPLAEVGESQALTRDEVATRSERLPPASAVPLVPPVTSKRSVWVALAAFAMVAVSAAALALRGSVAPPAVAAVDANPPALVEPARAANAQPNQTPTNEVPTQDAAQPPDAAAWLSLNSRPWSVVSIDGKTLPGVTPHMRLPVSAGKHHVVLHFAGVGKRKEFDIELAQGQHLSRVVELP